jgi:hypothetical protein
VGIDAKKGKTTAQKIGKWRSDGDMAFGKGDLSKAKKMFTKVIKAEPKNERNYYKVREEAYCNTHPAIMLYAEAV